MKGAEAPLGSLDAVVERPSFILQGRAKTLYRALSPRTPTMPPKNSCIISIPSNTLESIFPGEWTRMSVIDFVQKTAPGAPRSVCLIITELLDVDEMAIEIARVELAVAADGQWRLQYISHPSQSRGITAKITPQESDFSSYVQLLKLEHLDRPLATWSADVLEEEGLGPIASMNLRLDDRAPLVPSQANHCKLLAMGGELFESQF